MDHNRDKSILSYHNVALWIKRFSRRYLVYSFLWCCVLLLSCGERAAQPPNIIFILADDLGVVDVNSFDPLGRAFYETPRIDQLGQEGMRFVQAYANAANCAPTRAALESGQYFPNQPIYHVGNSGKGPMTPAENAHHLPLAKITGAEMLKQAGYTTALIGKWHLGEMPDYGPEQQGYDINIGGTGGGNPITWEGGFFEPNNNARIDDAEDGEYLTDYLTRKAIAFVEAHQAGPFYLNLSYYTPHSPFQAPDSLVAKYEQKESDQGHRHATYAAMVESMDTNIGKLMDALDDLGLAENTVVIFFSDNGGVGGYEYLGHGHRDVTVNTPLKGGKGTFYEGGIRVPMIVRWPGVIGSGTTSNEPVSGVDFYPTYLALADIEPPEEYILDGQSLLPLFQDPDARLDREAMLWHFPGYPNNPWRTTPVSVVRSGPWKLMRFYETEEVELYNVVEDVGEEQNLAGEMPAQVLAMEEVLDAWLEETDAPLPEWPQVQK